MSALFSRTDQSILGQWWWTVDRALLAALAVLIITGIMLVTTASPPVADRLGYGSQYHFLIRHIIFLIPALAMMITASVVSAQWIWRGGTILLGLGILGLFAVMLFGTESNGAQRWIVLLGFSVQPSEFVKPAFAVVAAWFIAREKERPGGRGYLIAGGLFAFLVLMLALQPDIGMTFVLTAIFGAQICLAGLPLWVLSGFGVLAAGGLVGAYFMFPHFQNRVDRHLDPASGDSFQIGKSLDAFREGGLMGVGPGQGTVKLGLPDAHADFIFSVAAEEMGMLLALFILAVYGFIILRVISRLMDSDDLFAVLAVGGLVTMFGLQAFIHIGSSIGLLPPKGMTLPFISYGGSSLWAMALGMGAILALTRRIPRSTVVRQSPFRAGKKKAQA